MLYYYLYRLSVVLKHLLILLKKSNNVITVTYILELVAGNVWILIMLIGFTLFPFLFLLRTANFYEGNQMISLTETAKYVVILTLFSLFLLIFTLCFYR